MSEGSTSAGLGLLTSSIGNLDGAGLLALEETMALRSTGHKIVVAASDISEVRQYDGDSTEGIYFTKSTRDIPFPRNMDGKFPRYAIGWIKQLILDSVKWKDFSHFAPDLLFVNSFIYSHQTFMRRLYGRIEKSVLIVHESVGHFDSHEKWRLAWAMEAFDYYNAIVFSNEFSRSEWLNVSGMQNKSCYIIPNCARENAIGTLLSESKADVRSRLGFSTEEFAVVCPASIQRRKGQDLILDLYSRLIEKAPKMKIYLLGSVSNDGVDIIHRISQGSYSSLSYVGSRKDAMDFIRAADVLLLPSRAEVMPLSIVEAMALGTPVVASDIAGIPEMIAHGESGMLFPLSDPRKMVDCLAAIYSDKCLAEQMAKRASEKYWDDFSRERYHARYATVVRDMIG